MREDQADYNKRLLSFTESHWIENLRLVDGSARCRALSTRDCTRDPSPAWCCNSVDSKGSTVILIWAV